MSTASTRGNVGEAAGVEEDEDSSRRTRTSSPDEQLLAMSLPLPPPPPPPRLGLARLLSSCSISESCPICLDPMTVIDHQHPLLCPTRHCHYNFCASCITSLLSSSKDDYELASDGNAHVKVFLHCPNCRSDLSQTIRDTLLLRKVDTVTWLLSKSSSTTEESSTSSSTTKTPGVSLTPSQERTKAAMQELDVQETIQKARDVEEAFWRQYNKNLSGGDGGSSSSSGGGGRCVSTSSSTAYSSNSGPVEASAASITRAASRRSSLMRLEASIQELSVTSGVVADAAASSAVHDDDSIGHDDVGDEEWGVEADLIHGVHSSIRLPPEQQQELRTLVSDSDQYQEQKKSQTKAKAAIDATLLQGLEFGMTYSEKVTVTRWMTSGNVSDLVLAARLIVELENFARQGLSPAKRQARHRRGSVYEIVDEARKLHEQQEEKKEEEKTASTGIGATTAVQAWASPMSRRGGRPRRNSNNNNNAQILAERRQLERAIEEQTRLLERFPLPVRMPKCVELELRVRGSDIHAFARRFPLRFCDDTWDGTVLDAYSKITVSGRPPNCEVAKKKTHHAGVCHVLSMGKYTKHYGPVEMTMEHPPARVLIASLQGEAGRKGVMRGDVVTHVDGEEFHGTVDDLLQLLYTKATTTTAGDQRRQHHVELILNAELSVAEALRRRAVVMQ